MVDEEERRSRVYGEVWRKLSKVDVSEHVETKMNLSYLSWAWAWDTLMKHYPEAEYVFTEEKFYPDGSCNVECIVDIRGCDRKMWLPVMDNRNNAITNPNARQISDARMRCLVKCLAIFGLGHYLYAGEDTPSEQWVPEPVLPEVKSTKKKKAKKANGSKPNGEGEVPKVADLMPELEAGIHIAIREFIKECKDIGDLVEYYKDQETELNKLKKGNPDEYAECMTEFTKRKEELQSAGN